MDRKAIFLFALSISSAMAAQAPQVERIPLVMTGEQKQQLRAMSAEMGNAQRDEVRAKEDQAKLIAERTEWVKKVESDHPGYKIVPAQDGLYLERTAPAKESK